MTCPWHSDLQFDLCHWHLGSLIGCNRATEKEGTSRSVAYFSFIHLAVFLSLCRVGWEFVDLMLQFSSHVDSLGIWLWAVVSYTIFCWNSICILLWTVLWTSSTWVRQNLHQVHGTTLLQLALDHLQPTWALGNSPSTETRPPLKVGDQPQAATLILVAMSSRPHQELPLPLRVWSHLLLGWGSKK